MYRQGDILIIPTKSHNHGSEIERDNGRVVLAYGEVTGHAHAIAAPEATLYNLGDGSEASDRLLTALAPVILRHEEHAPINLPAGNYVIRRQREYTPEAVRYVAD